MFIYWGGEGGTYSKTNRTDLPAESSSGIQTVDLNRDGYPEIVVHNHMKDGDHTINSYIYWNGPEGFHRDRRSEVPNFGPHYSQMTDPGNLYTRKLEEEYLSPPLELSESGRPVSLFWEGEEPHGARLKFQIRTAASRQALASEEWQGPGGKGFFYQSSGTAIGEVKADHGWLQYRTVFTSPARRDLAHLVGGGAAAGLSPDHPLFPGATERFWGSRDPGQPPCLAGAIDCPSLQWLS